MSYKNDRSTLENQRPEIIKILPFVIVLFIITYLHEREWGMEQKTVPPEPDGKDHAPTSIHLEGKN